MSEKDPSAFSGGAEMAPVIAIGGLLTIKRHLPLYRPLLSGQTASELPASERFFPIPDRGLGHHEEMFDQLASQVIGAYERLEEPPVLVGHSLGGLMATKFGLEHPDKVSAVVCLAGVQEGIKHETPSSFLLNRFLGSPPGRQLIQHDSDHMTAHKQKIAEDWSADVPLHLISPTFDDLLLLPQGLGLELPEGQEPQRRVVGLPGTGFLLRFIPGMPKNTQILSSPALASHVDIPANIGVIRYTRAIRRAVASNVEPLILSSEPVPLFQPGLKAVA
jgi:hypothetical protein